jgi:hypothetical protein
MNGQELQQQIQDIQDQFYSTSGKNTFFKKYQKQQCAQLVATQMSPELLITNTFRILGGTNRVYVNYPLFKTFMNADLIPVSVQYIINIGRMCVEKYGCMEVHINMDTFTPTAAERYREFVMTVLKTCEKENTNFSYNLSTMNLYNCPKVADQLSRVLWTWFPPMVQEKVKIFGKDESVGLLDNLLSGASSDV